ncbi:hypothetical protein PG993_005916 [Apiospora rasikravindrae]|uniref:Uncharacterized protein n=1 Tax=Apiospora rasikravindrae TaxID=990691 RepID=A0ABR1TA56_9PEZI
MPVFNSKRISKADREERDRKDNIRKRDNEEVKAERLKLRKPQKSKRCSEVVPISSGLPWNRLRDEFLLKKWPKEDFSQEPVPTSDGWRFETPENFTEDDRRAISDLATKWNITAKEVNAVPPEVDDDASSLVNSDTDSLFSVTHGSQFSSSNLSSVAESSASEGKSSAIVLLVDLLYRDEALFSLYHAAAKLYGPAKIQRSLQKLVRRYGRELKQEASDDAETDAAAFVCASAGHVARLITEAVVGESVHSLPQVPTETHKERTEEWLLNRRAPQQNTSRQDVVDDIENIPDIDELDEKEVYMTYQTLNALLRFLRFSKAFDHLKQTLTKMENDTKPAGEEQRTKEMEFQLKAPVILTTASLEVILSRDCVNDPYQDSQKQRLGLEVSDAVKWYCDQGVQLDCPEKYRLSSTFVRSAVSAWTTSKSNTTTLLDMIMRVAPFSTTRGIVTAGAPSSPQSVEGLASKEKKTKSHYCLQAHGRLRSSSQTYGHSDTRI